MRPTWTWRSPSFFSVSVTATITVPARIGAGVADLAAQFAIEGRLVGDDQHVLAGTGFVDQLAALDQGQHAALGTVGLVAQELGGAVLVADVEPDALDRSLARALPGGARSLALAGHGGVEAGGIDGTAFGAERVLGEVEREAERVVETEGDLAGEGLAGAETAGLLLEEPQATLQRAAEAGLLQAQHLGDQAFGPDQLGEGLAHLGHEDGHHAPQHGLAGTQELGVAHAAAHDPAQHVAAALVGRHDAVGDQEGGGAQVVGDHLVRGLALAFGLGAGERLRGADQRPEEVDIVIVVVALEDGGDALEAHAGVDRGPGQRHAGGLVHLLVLHEDEVPESR